MDKTKQDEFWMGESGDKYADVNRDSAIGSQLNFFSKVLSRTVDVHSAYEIGANVGLNLDALKALRPQIELSGCEINKKSIDAARAKGYKIDYCSVFDLKADKTYDLVFTKCVLIHLNPDLVEKAYRAIGELASRYILIDEFFSPVPVPIESYYGEQNVLFKRDFGREIRDCLDLKLLDYGFISKIDPNFPGYDTNWYLFEKRS